MSKVLLSAALTVAIAVSLTGCSSNEPAKSSGTTSAPVASSEKAVSQTNPIIIDKVAKTVKVYTEVNGKYFVEPTRHGVVFKDGSNGSKSVLKAWGNQNDFYNALTTIGAKPGNNLKLDSVGVAVEGDPLDVSITWDGAGKELPFGDAILDSTKKNFDFRFGGNQENAKAKNTGCILCLDSCPVGITSNAAHPTKDFDNKIAEFKGNNKVLPADGTPVVVTFKLK
ncbi:YdjY domain-containing protein [Desulfosporosinus sp. Sb-LF]|uniref:YdjY domain-containing protein n=1 Tax=Desulfosporosinus sp. Sb-LF TaxID=2560027 RepID=UPI001FB10760|nr:YdjY domain-containing protein [Desulfosporosinus sp. Sb-LF]